jgi:ABC-type polysaccharide/polyol phosphate export permease
MLTKYISDIYKRKDLLLYLVSSGLKAQHRNSILGYIWWLLDPLLSVLIYYFVVVVVFNRGGDGYGVYLVVGMIVWRWLNTTASSASRSIVHQAQIITQVYMPKAVFPISLSFAQLVNFGFGLIVIGIFMLFFRIVPGAELLWLPFLTLILFIFLLSIALILAFFSVFIRDIENFLDHLLRLWFFASPVIWESDMIPDRFQFLIWLNPMSYFLEGYRNVLIYNSSPNVMALLIIGLISIVAIVISLSIYNRNEHKIIKVL